MKKYLALFCCLAVVSAFTACEDSGSASLDASSLAEFATIAVSMGNATCGSSSQASGVSAASIGTQAAGSYSLEDSCWISYSSTNVQGTYEIKFRFLDDSDAAITGASILEVYVLASTSAKKLNLVQSVETPEGSFAGDLYFTFDTVGQPDLGGSLSGTLTGSETATGADFAATYTNVRGDDEGMTSGTITLTATAAGQTWTISLTVDDGVCTGSITGPGYTATITVNHDGTGTYTDESGEHIIA